MPVSSKLIALLSSSSPLRLFTSSSSPLRLFTVGCLARYTHHPFAAFSSASVFHGRHYSVFNRPNFRFWYGAANHFHSEAAINERCGEGATSFSDSQNSHPWPEWSKLAGLLAEKGYLDRCITSGDDDDTFLADEDLPEEFLKAAKACLGFARDRPDILRLLAKKNVEAIVLNGFPFLFKNGENSARRLKLYLTGEGSNELELEKAQTIDVMRYLLSHVYGLLSSSDDTNLTFDKLVESSVRKLLCELFNLSGTVWKPKSVDATLAELPSSNEQLSVHLGQYAERSSGDLIYPNLHRIPVRSSAASENQPNVLDNTTDKEYRNSIFNQKQGPEETPSSEIGGRSPSTSGFISYSGQPSASTLDEKLESQNRVQMSSTSNAQLPTETNAAYGFTNPGQPFSHSGNNYNSYYGGYTGKSTQPSFNSWTNSCPTYGGSIATSSTPPSSSLNEHPATSYNGYNANAYHNSSAFHGRPTTNSSQVPTNSWNNNHNTSFTGSNVGSAQPSNTLWSNSNPSHGGSSLNSSQPPPSESWSNYNTANPALPSSNSWCNGITSYGKSTPNSSPPPIGYHGNYSTQYEGYSSTSQTGFTSNSWNTNNASPGGFHEELKQPSNISYSSSTAYSSPQPPNNSWNNYNTPYGENVTKSTQPSGNYWSNNNTSFGSHNLNSSHPPSNSWNNHNTNPPANSTEPSMSSRNSNNSYAGVSADSYHRYPANSNQQSSHSWNNSSSSYPGASANPTQSTCSTWNNSRESYSGFPQTSNGLPSSVNANYGYSGRSLEGSCVKEGPDPLDMSEEAKAERWFRRAAQIKDISELSQIPDEDFPQIMPMRKGVNRFVVSKRKTPLERRLASQQYKRSLPVVSSEPEKEPTARETEINLHPD
ncbi:probable serine/threonine-protein kinase clkA [Phalaenopsis equestris]|uniref:probable serine/threonine-protein kinase clkA n=1 Tax=Phalaenopsis equestris TaxID=78828 RepID=UPI0009E2ABB3|nr:probable serine/threonine-protein kinase clkA [Phalaenopsis equestris]